MQQENTRRGFTQEVVNKNSHSRVSLSGICCDEKRDPRVLRTATSGMTGKSAFTLIELLVVVVIIGILASIALPQYQKAVIKARLAEAQTLISTLEKATDVYRLEKNPSGSSNITDQLEISLSGDFSQEKGGYSHCNDKKICIAVDSNSVNVFVFGKNDVGGGAPDYSLYSRWDSTTGWQRKYMPCNVNIQNYGLEKLGYTYDPSC